MQVQKSCSKDFGTKKLLVKCWWNWHQGDFPEEGYEDGVIADNYMRRHLTRSGFRRLTGVKVDDLFVYTDGDELILPEILVRILTYLTITFVFDFKIVLDKKILKEFSR